MYTYEKSYIIQNDMDWVYSREAGWLTICFLVCPGLGLQQGGWLADHLDTEVP